MKGLKSVLLIGNPFTFEEFQIMRCNAYCKTFLVFDASNSYLGLDCPKG